MNEDNKISLSEFWNERNKRKNEFPLLACWEDLETGNVYCMPTPRIGNKEVFKKLDDILLKIMEKYSKSQTEEERITEFENQCKDTDKDTLILTTYDSDEELRKKTEIAKKYKKEFFAISSNETENLTSGTKENFNWDKINN